MVAAPIRSKKRVYPVGRRNSYVYWLVQGETDLASRADDVRRYTAEYELTDDEIADLAKSLAALDQRRAAKPVDPPAPAPRKPVDPYWSLWGKLKSRARRFDEE